MQALRNFADNQFAFAMLISVFLLAMGITVASKFDSKFGYVLMILGVAFGLYTLKVNRIF